MKTCFTKHSHVECYHSRQEPDLKKTTIEFSNWYSQIICSRKQMQRVCSLCHVKTWLKTGLFLLFGFCRLPLNTCVFPHYRPGWLGETPDSPWFPHLCELASTAGALVWFNNFNDLYDGCVWLWRVSTVCPSSYCAQYGKVIFAKFGYINTSSYFCFGGFEVYLYC